MSERKESNLHNESQILTHCRYATLRVKIPYSHEQGIEFLKSNLKWLIVQLKTLMKSSLSQRTNHYTLKSYITINKSII